MKTDGGLRVRNMPVSPMAQLHELSDSGMKSKESSVFQTKSKMVVLNFKGNNNDITPAMFKASKLQEPRTIFQNRRNTNQHDSTSIYMKAKHQLNTDSSAMLNVNNQLKNFENDKDYERIKKEHDAIVESRQRYKTTVKTRPDPSY